MPEGSGPRTAAGGDRPVVLVVEDDQAIRLLVRETLADEGYEVIEAADSEEALSVLSRQRPGLILLDMRLPGPNGEAFAEEYVKAEDNPAPIILFTAGSVRTRPPGVVAVLTKPFDVDELVELVEAQISS